MALTHDFNPQVRSPERVVAYDVAAGAVIYRGAMVAINSAGYAIAAEDATGQVVVGVGIEKMDNTTGASGTRKVRVQKGAFSIHNSASAPVTRASIGRPCYVEDDGTVRGNAGTGNVLAGIVESLEIGIGGQNLVFVYFA